VFTQSYLRGADLVRVRVRVRVKIRDRVGNRFCGAVSLRVG
jgi:hypothetical protein